MNDEQEAGGKQLIIERRCWKGNGLFRIHAIKPQNITSLHL
jgi:hypothetical protein